nr:hypothetical protein VITISV_043093 [Ipomoea trifida]
MVSELAGEGAMLLPKPASHAELRVRLRRSIRGGSLVDRRHFKVCSLSFPEKNQLMMLRSVAFTESTTMLLRLSPSIASSSSRSRSVKLLSAMLVNPLFAGSRSRSAENTMSTELINRSSVAIVIPSPLVLEQWRSWSRSMKKSSRVLVNPLFIAFDCHSWSRSVEIDNSSEEIEDKAENLDNDDGEELTAVNKIRRRRFVFSDDDEISTVVSRSQSVNYDVIVSTQLSNAWFNSNCKEASEWLRKGWRRWMGEFADISDWCASAYKEGKFCETFHLNASGVSGIYQIVKMIVERKFQPIIIFSFSRRECEQHAMSMSKFDFNTEEEKDAVEQVFRNVVLCLNEEDRSLPTIELMLPLLQRGIDVHHSGLLPIIKELVELLFQEGLVKAPFVTETFAIGLNMPANLFEEFVGKLNDMVVLLPLSKIGKPKAKEGDGVNVKRGSEDYMVSRVEWNYKKFCNTITVEFNDCSKQILEMESQIPSLDCFREDFVVLLRCVQTQEKQKLNLTDTIRGDLRSPSPSKALIASKSSSHSKSKNDQSDGQMPSDKTIGGGDDVFNTFFSETGAGAKMKSLHFHLSFAEIGVKL